MTPRLAILLVSALLCGLASLRAAEAENLIRDGSFSEWEGAKPAHWTVRSKQSYAPVKDGGGMHVEVTRREGGYGEILQRIPIQPDARYRLSGEMRGSKGLAFFQVKRYANGKEMDRSKTSYNGVDEWKQIEKVFTAGGAEHVEILIRWKQKEEDVGKAFDVRNVALVKLPPLTWEGAEVPPRAVPTFNSVGLYWKPTGGTASRSVTVAYRKQGSDEWKDAQPLWFDTMQHSGGAIEHTAEYRGSIVYLDSGTAYEARLRLEEGPERIVEFSTLSEDFKIARKVTVPVTYDDGVYVINEGGSAEDGYVLYEPAEGVNAVWDANDQAKVNIKVEASWVIIRGLTLKGASVHGIELGDVQHVVIDNCEITGWGATGNNGQAKNLNSAVYSSSKELENIVIQYCDIHHPRSDSNSWNQKRPGTNSSHPEGPQAVSFRGGDGRYIIRYNRIYSDMDHMFNDGMGEFKNFSYGGFPNRDSDIHDNFVSHCWDDGLEIEGANMNVRIWNNYIDMTYGAMGGASTSLGPVYFFRNVYAVSRKHEGTEDNDFRGHYLLKIGNERVQYTRGKMFVFHNTTLQPPKFEEFGAPSSGAQSGIAFTSSKKLQENITSRNNVFQMRYDRDWAIKDTQRTQSNDYDYDLYSGRLMVKEGSQANGIAAAPTYERAPDGRLWLVPGTPGHDAGERIANFNDGFVGEAPDMGAVETHSERPKPQHWPDFPENYRP